MNKEHKMDILKKAGIYLVTSSAFSARPTMETIELSLKAGCRLFQLREKNLSKRDLSSLAYAAKKLSMKYDAVFILNDHVDIAVDVGADGVHLGQHDLSVTEARKACKDSMIIGVSTHNRSEILKAHDDGADYLNIGPIFPTNTKDVMEFIGVEELLKLVPFVKIPFTLMGGIKESNLQKLLKVNPAAFAMVTEITMAADIETKIKNLFNSIYTFNSLC